MASCTIVANGVSGTLSRRYADESVQEKFHVRLDTPTRSVVSVCNTARLANPTQFPLRGEAWPAEPMYGLFADSFQCEMLSELGYSWHVTVTYAPLRPNESNTEGTNDNPLLWPAIYSLDWIETEVAITEGRNVEALGSAAPTPRPALTNGPVVNAALQEFEEGIFDSRRDAVLVIQKNVATLDEVLAIERDYALTTNSDTVLGIGPRRYKYLGVESSGRQVSNGIIYYPRTIRVAILKTTDRQVNNVGWHYWTTINDVKQLVRAKVKDDDNNKVDSAEPVFLATTGGLSVGTPVKITYRYLTEVPYAGLLI